MLISLLRFCGFITFLTNLCMLSGILINNSFLFFKRYACVVFLVKCISCLIHGMHASFHRLLLQASFSIHMVNPLLLRDKLTCLNCPMHSRHRYQYVLGHHLSAHNLLTLQNPVKLKCMHMPTYGGIYMISHRAPTPSFMRRLHTN